MFQPVVPGGGLAGWRFLQQTYTSQLETFSNSNVIARDVDYFTEKIGDVKTADDLVSDRRLLTVALGAFGLQDDISNRYFIQKVLEEGTASNDTLANKLSDTRYRDLADAFGFGPQANSVRSAPGFAQDIVGKFEKSSFEIAAGTQSDSLRIALYAERSLGDLASRTTSNDAKWFSVLGDPPMRQLFEKALGLPSSIGQIDIDQQLGIFKERSEAVFGSDDFSTFLQADIQRDVIDRFIVRDQLEELNRGFSSGSIALQLLQS